MSDKFIDYRTGFLPRLNLADLERYIPIIEHAVLCDNEQMTRHLVITSDQLRFEQRAGTIGRERLRRLIDGINSGRGPYQYRDGTHPVEDLQLRAAGRPAPRPRAPMTIETAFRLFLDWLARSGYRYVQSESMARLLAADEDFNTKLFGGGNVNVLYNPMESIGNCSNVAHGFAMMLVCVGVPITSLSMAFIEPVKQKRASVFAYVGERATRFGAVPYVPAASNRNEYRSRVMHADGERFVAVPGSEIDNPFGNHWVVKARGALWDGNYACRYDEPSQVCEAYSSVYLRGRFIDDAPDHKGRINSTQWCLLSPLDGSMEQFVEVGQSQGAFKDEVKRVTGFDNGAAYVVLKPGDPWCQVDMPSSEGPKTVPLRLAREAGYVVPANWSTNQESQAFVKNAVATAIGNYRNDTSFWNSKSADTDAFLKSAVKWIGTDDVRCKSVKAKFFEKDDLTKVYALPEHPIYQNLYYVLGFDPTGEHAVPKSVVGQRLRGFLLNAFKVPAQIKAAAGA
ncbi:MAG: hypothetical protein NTY17_05740 [Planctomycetia bacterium]|nr:hypothetical protein [Planctomycetia bacterium]